MSIFSTPTKNVMFLFTTPEHEQKQDKQGYSLRTNDDDYVYAKKILNVPTQYMDANRRPNLNYSHFIRYHNNTLYDPRTIHSIPENNTTFINEVCKDKKWIQVDPQAFMKYLEFLKLGGDQHYKEAVRNCIG